MTADESLILWLEKVKEGDEQAAQVIWEQYFSQLAQVAARRLPKATGLAEDEEDVALSALESFFQAAQGGRFAELRDRDSLWRLLSEMTRRKVVDRIRRGMALKQGGGELRGESAFVAGEPAADWKQGRPTDVEQAAILREQIHRFLAALREKDPRLEQLAVAKMEGHTNEQLAQQFERSLPTVERWLQRIRKIGGRIFDE